MNQIATGETVAEVDIKRIMEMIPHRYPMLMIDRVVDIVPNVRAVGIKNVTANEHYFQGHFPNQPVMPGVMLIESMAQTAAVLVVQTLGDVAARKVVYFMSVDGARFRRPVIPGDTLRITVEKIHHRKSVWKFFAEVKVGDRVYAEASFAAMIIGDG